MKTKNLLTGAILFLALTAETTHAQTPTNALNPTGNAGVGTTNPQFKLHVVNGAIYSDQGLLMVSKSSNEGGQINIYNHLKTSSSLPKQNIVYSIFNMTGNYGDKFSIWGYPYGQNGIERFSIWDNGSFTFNNTTVPSTPIIYILSRGSMGIGVSDTSKLNIAGYKLFVGSGILTEKIKVTTYANWADYVFASDYKLKGLNEVETFIQQNKHLPNIPSAKEVKEQGIDLAEMQAKQMEKIEELTLYIIEQNKMNAAQNKTIELLKAKIEHLENK